MTPYFILPLITLSPECIAAFLFVLTDKSRNKVVLYVRGSGAGPLHFNHK